MSSVRVATSKLEADFAAGKRMDRLAAGLVWSGPNSGPEFVRTCQDASQTGRFPSPSRLLLPAPQVPK